MTRYMLDTDISSYLLDGRLSAVERRLARVDPRDVFISVVPRRDTLRTAATRHKESLHSAATIFLNKVQSVPWTIDAAIHYARVRHQLTVEGN